MPDPDRLAALPCEDCGTVIRTAAPEFFEPCGG